MLSENFSFLTFCVTLMRQVAEAFPSPEVAVITAEPAPTAVTTPFELTVATFLFEEVHLTVLSEAESGVTEAERAFAFPASRVTEE